MDNIAADTDVGDAVDAALVVLVYLIEFDAGAIVGHDDAGAGTCEDFHIDCSVHKDASTAPADDADYEYDDD